MRPGSAVKVERTCPVPYSPVMMRTPRTAATSTVKPTDEMLRLTIWAFATAWVTSAPSGRPTIGA